MRKRGIVSFGAYLPRHRLDRKIVAQANSWANPSLVSAAKGSRAMCAHDEDSITMAVAAGRNALGCDGNPDDLTALFFASTTMPFADRQNATLVGEAISLPQQLRALDSGGSLRAGVGALLTALHSDDRAMVIASDHRSAKPGSAQELRFGDGAAAITVGSENLLAELVGSYSLSVDFNDHYRASDAAFDYVLEERWARELGQLGILPEAISGALDAATVSASEIRHAIIGNLGSRESQIVAAKCGIDKDAIVADAINECGDTGVSYPLLLTTRALKAASPGDLILVAGYGHGAEALIFRATENIEAANAMIGLDAEIADGVPDNNYLRYLSFNGHIGLDWGMRAERDNKTAQSAFYRHKETVTQAIGGRCTACDTPQFPKSRICANPDCRKTDTQVPEPFADKPASVKSFTEDWLALSFNPPLMYGNIRFEGGGVAMLEFSDFEPGELAVGKPLALAFRIKDFDEKRAFRRYCWKAIPPRNSIAASLSQGKNNG